MKIITLLIFLFSFNVALASEDSFITTEVYKYSSKNGTPVFTDKKPKNKTHQTQTIEAVKSTGNGGYETALMDRRGAKTSRRSSKRKSKKDKTIKIKCKQYKKILEDVSDEMRTSFNVKNEKRLKKRRAKYKDLLFRKCDGLVNYL